MMRSALHARTGLPRCVPPRLLLCLAAALTAGCATDQAADVDLYRSISDPPGTRLLHTDGQPLSLADAMRFTAWYNELLAAQGERYIQALAERQRAASLLRPTLSAFGDVALRENTGSAGIVQSAVGVSGQYRFLTGLTDLRNVDAALARAEAERWLILDLREALLVQTARAYYDTLRAEKLAAVLEVSVKTQTERLQDARTRNEAGVAPPLDVALIDAQVSRTRAQLIEARRAAGEARSTLALLTNARIAASPLTDCFTVPASRPDTQALISLARSNRQDLAAARHEAAALRDEVDAAIGQYAPSIALNLDYFLLRGPDTSAPSLASLLSVQVPVFTAGRIEAEVRGSWSRFRQQVLLYRSLEREAQRDVETAALRLLAAESLIEELRAQVAAASLALELAEAAYAAGLGTNLERIVAQDALLSAELETVSAEFDAKIAYLELLRACGTISGETIGTLPPPPPSIPVPESPFLDRPGPAVPTENAP